MVWVGETWSFGKGGGVSSKLQVYLSLNSVLNVGGVDDDPNAGRLKSSFCSLKKCRSSNWSLFNFRIYRCSMDVEGGEAMS